MKRRVAVTGLGMVAPHGSALGPVFDALMRGESAVRLGAVGETPFEVARPMASCADFDPVAALGKARSNNLDRYSQLGLAAGIAAWQDAGLDTTPEYARTRFGVSWSTGMGGAQTIERSYRDFFLRGKKRISPSSIVLTMSNAAASHLALNFGLGGACLTYSVACASSTVAIGEAMRKIQYGELDVALAGGSEALLNFGVVMAWDSLQVLATGDEATAHRACRPFASDRTGLVLGEGGACLILEDWEHALARGARIYAELAGYGSQCDHSHLTLPQREGQVRTLYATLADAKLHPAEVGYVNAHGTATREGDAVEVSALVEVFGEHAPRLPVSATKSVHGHLMGATGAMEALITVLALHRRELPPTAHLDAIDPACTGVRHLSTGESAPALQAALSNSFAFGGSNAVLAFRTPA